MIVDKEGRMFEDRRKNNTDRRKNNIEIYINLYLFIFIL